MRKITEESINAFMNDKRLIKGNMYVTKRGGHTVMYLHENPIAFKNYDGTIRITNSGWFTPTTKERLNGIPGVHISQIKGKWYLNGIEWNGKTITINEQWYEIY